MKKIVVLVLHLTYWSFYILLLLMLYGMAGLGSPKGGRPAHLLYILAESALLPGVIAYYCFYTFLFSEFLAKRRILSFVLLGLLICVLTVVPAEILLYFQIKGAIWTIENCIGVGLFITVNALMNGGLGLVMRSFVQWYGDIKIKEELSKKNYETELALVKSQINPHFLFNTLNNIDVLIIKDPVTASAYLNKLSDIMRFMLYETKTEKVPLSKELDYIEKYIELQRIRGSNPNYIDFKVNGDVKDKWIEPMLLIPFIENAFKHTENKSLEKAVSISILISQNKIIFECSNRTNERSASSPDHSGLGKGLIQKRLSLLYPKKHKLQMDETGDLYLVKLELDV